MFDPAQYRKEKAERVARGERKYAPEPPNPSGPPAFDPAQYRAARGVKPVEAVPVHTPAPARKTKKAAE